MITIEPLLGNNRSGVEVDTGVDAIYVTEAGKRKRVGILGRVTDAPIQMLVRGLAPVIMSAIKAAVAEHQAGDGSVIDQHKKLEVQEPPEVLDDER